MQGTVYNRNLIHRVADAWNVIKGVPTPAELYPPQQMVGGPFWQTWQGWPAEEERAGSLDQARIRKAVQSPSVFANMRAIATEFASSELIVKERTSEGLEDVDNHPLEELWAAPNDDMGRAFLMQFWAWSYTMAGKSYLYWLPAGGVIQEVWPIPPWMITPIPATKEFIGGYAFRSRRDSEPMLIPRDLITYSRSPNLFDVRDGLSFLVAGMTPIESEIAMGFWNKNFFSDQNGVPDGMISLSRDALDVDVNRVRSELRDFFGGTQRGIAVARSGDMEYKVWGRSQKDAEFTEGIKLASTQIGRLMGFPDGYWSESANRANAEQARATMIAGAVWPLLVALHEDMNAGVVRRWYGEDYRAEFKDIRPEDRQLKLQELQFYVQIETINELRKRIGDDELDDPRGEMLIAEINKGAPLPATPAQEETDEYLAEQEAELAPEEEASPEEAAPPPEEAPVEGGEVQPIEEGVAMPEEAPMKVAAIDLRRWEAKALKDITRKGRVYRSFDSVAIAPDEHARITAALKGAATVEEVKEAFKAKPAKRVTVADLADDAAVLERARKLREEVKG